MDFKKFIKAANDPEAKKKAMEGFDERERKRNAKFALDAKKLEPTPEWYNRQYTI